jgi:hypothetical protein
MSKNDQQNPKKIKKQTETGGSKPKNKVKAEKLKVDAADNPEEINPKPQNEQKAEKPKQKAISEINKSGVNKSETNKFEIEHPNSEIKNMEVHYHPQLDHKPKPWKEYLLEGFMIFIAVMMGFIAENIREIITNNEHVRQLTSQLVQDLKADTAQLNGVFRGETQIVKYNDTLINLLQQPLKKADTRRIQVLVANSHSMWLFHPSLGAIAAIKNELHLKQFSNSKIIGYFAGYETRIELLHTDQDINLQYQRLYLDPFLTAHFTPENMVAAFMVAALKTSPMPTVKMRSLSQGDLDQLAADMVLIRIISKEMVADNRKVKIDAANLLKYVKKQYNLEGE